MLRFSSKRDGAARTQSHPQRDILPLLLRTYYIGHNERKAVSVINTDAYLPPAQVANTSINGALGPTFCPTVQFLVADISTHSSSGNFKHAAKPSQGLFNCPTQVGIVLP
jgi:hypothetical protein